HDFVYVMGGTSILEDNKIHICAKEDMTVIDTIDISPLLPEPVTDIYWDEERNWLYIGSHSGLGIYDPYYIEQQPTISVSEYLDTDGNHTISWKQVSEADWYILERSYIVDFSISITIYEGNETQHLITNMSEGLYWYRTKANNSVRTTEWSGAHSVMVVYVPIAPDISQLLSPNTDGNYTISWSVVNNANNYTLEESNISDFSAYTTIYIGGNTSFDMIDKPNGQYYYRVKATNLAGDSSWSNVETITVSIETNRFNPQTYILPIALTIMVLLSILYSSIRNQKKKNPNKEKNDENLEEET
ncbi:MAG: fibronectin type III domain-containing protein, partial [Thermoplasmata archaeon]|nr:fibronectin type III domain-containing protein [Thermoplasmata archaeon]